VTLDPTPATRYDLRFTALGVPVRVHPLFWLVSIIFAVQLPPPLAVIWVGVVFVSIFIHELGHALTIRAFGWYPLNLL
jgi:stage IV sporulation protein FB